MKLELQRDRQCADYNLAVCVLASGSKGNAIFISDGVNSILLDAGISATEIKRRLKSRGLSPKDLDAILLSHEHSDHIQSAGVLSRQLKLPIYLSRKIKKKVPLGNRVHEIRTFACGVPFQINHLTVHPFTVLPFGSNNAAKPPSRISPGRGCISRGRVQHDRALVVPGVARRLTSDRVGSQGITVARQCDLWRWR